MSASGHLCLKWNNHSSAFLKSISKIQMKERYCDATIACQGKYFPVHRIILSTCSDYFDEIFERMQCQHPYIVFKDIEPREMELLLNYMYQGEVNVLQEMLPTLIKAAEALKIKGLAVPDDMPPNKDYSAKKRSSSNDENPQPKRRSEESKRRRRNSSDLNLHPEISSAREYSNTDVSTNSSENSTRLGSLDQHLEHNGHKIIKEEPLESVEYDSGTTLHPEYGAGTLPVDEGSVPPLPGESVAEDGSGFTVDFPTTTADSSSSYIKEEGGVSAEESYEDQVATWSGFSSANVMQNLPPAEMGARDDMSEMNLGLEASEANSGFQIIPENCQQNEDNTPLGYRNCNPRRTSSLTHHCPYCDYQSANSAHLRNHIKYKHTGERPYPCSVCSKRFVEKISVVRHMRIHTGEKPFECPNCSMKFNCRSKGERPFPCSACSMRFAQKVDLERHIRIHTGEKPFVCPNCPMKFNQKNNMKAHMKKKHTSL